MVGEYKFNNQQSTLRLKIETVDLTELGNRQAFLNSLKYIVEK